MHVHLRLGEINSLQSPRKSVPGDTTLLDPGRLRVSACDKYLWVSAEVAVYGVRTQYYCGYVGHKQADKVFLSRIWAHHVLYM
jgi:hypothetical protein